MSSNKESVVMEGNEVIAKFLGFEKTGHSYEHNGVRHFKYKSDQFGMTYPGEWAFSTNLNWLMPVVEKISEMASVVIRPNKNGGICSIEMFFIAKQKLVKETGIKYDYIEPLGECSSGPTIIANTYKAVLEFINWYNTNKRESMSKLEEDLRTVLLDRGLTITTSDIQALAEVAKKYIEKAFDAGQFKGNAMAQVLAKQTALTKEQWLIENGISKPE
jgi:hypothetical protein